MTVKQAYMLLKAKHPSVKVGKIFEYNSHQLQNIPHEANLL